jgi:hypothetical protein
VTLAEVAAEYEREAHAATRFTAQERLRRQAQFLRRTVANRDAINPAQLRLYVDMPLDLPVRWCRQHGYRACLGYGGLTLQCDGEPVIVASAGDTLHWDGHRITLTTP